ncbi:MAG: transposase [Minisyncoccales bacterium]
MPYRKQIFVNNEIYHIVTRRIGNELLFKDTDDYYRGIFSIYEFNNIKPVEIWLRRKFRAKIKAKGDPLSQIDNRDPLVEVLLFCLMPNHIHFLLRQLKDGGITKYMNKFGAGYPAYFKRKYNLRDVKDKGYFFQGRFMSVHIKTEEQLKTIFVYIHTNPISLIEPNWKETGIQNPDKAIDFLENYKWSSYLDYLGKKNFPSVTKRDFILEIIGGAQGARAHIENWIRYKGEIKEFSELALEN